MDLFTIAGTTFAFETLPPDPHPERAERERARRREILGKALSVKPFKPGPAKVRRPYRVPRPGNGEFHPEAGAPGSTVRVTIVDEEHNVPSVTVEGCVMFPAPGGKRDVWVSLWDGRAPIAMRLNDSLDAATIYGPSHRVAEYRERFATAETA